MSDRFEDARNWWSTSVSRIEPGIIEYRGHPVQELIGELGFVPVMHLLVCGNVPSPGRTRLLEAALVAAADHGPQAPSIAIARMAATCGIGLNGAVASAVNVLGDVHGGAGQQLVELLHEMQTAVDSGESRETVGAMVVSDFRYREEYVPGFGHRFHRKDPRRDPLMLLVEQAVSDGEVDGNFYANGLALESALQNGRTEPIPMNIDGATAIIYAELGFAPELARGFFLMSRAVGILAHAWEETGTGRRNKGPLPPPATAPYIGKPL